jgi:hypothetical protein
MPGRAGRGLAALPASAHANPSTSPLHRLPGIGIGRQELTEETLAQRTEAMIQSQTFGIMREPLALAGAQSASTAPACSVCSAMPSGRAASRHPCCRPWPTWRVGGGERRESGRPARHHADFRSHRQAHGAADRLRDATSGDQDQTAVRNKHGKLVYRTVRHKRNLHGPGAGRSLKPEKAIPAAAMYLAGMEQRYGGRDWAIWAYHCGEGCVADFRAMARRRQRGWTTRRQRGQSLLRLQPGVESRAMQPFMRRWIATTRRLIGSA